MIDCGRHFEPMDVLKRTLNGMAAVKLSAHSSDLCVLCRSRMIHKSLEDHLYPFLVLP